MKRVVLIGDSIRMGYQDTVREQLTGQAAVRTPEKNGGTSTNVLEHLDEWVFEQDAAIVHLNCGLHDLKKPFDSEQPQTPLETYRKNLETIFERITTHAGTRLIWATTTPVNQERHHAVKSFDRFEADVIAYNAAAAEVAARHDCGVDDLYALVMEAGRDRLLGKDGVHFTPEGYALLGQAVADRIIKAL